MNKLTLSAINMFWNMIVFDLDYSSLEYSTWNYKRYSRHYFQNKFFNKSDVIFIQLTHCRERDIKRCTFLFSEYCLLLFCAKLNWFEAHSYINSTRYNNATKIASRALANLEKATWNAEQRLSRFACRKIDGGVIGDR